MPSKDGAGQFRPANTLFGFQTVPVSTAFNRTL